MSLLDRVQKQQAPDPNAPPDGAYSPQAGQSPRQGLAAATRSRTPFELQAERIKNRLQARLIEESADAPGDEDREQRAAKITDALTAVIAEMGLSLTKPEKQRLLDSVLNDFLGLGPIEALISDPTITEIMVNGPDQIFVEHKGKLTLPTARFKTKTNLRRASARTASRLGGGTAGGSRWAVARLRAGSRANATIRPLPLTGPT